MLCLGGFAIFFFWASFRQFQELKELAQNPSHRNGVADEADSLRMFRRLYDDRASLRNQGFQGAPTEQGILD
jgi:hypothetical protein